MGNEEKMLKKCMELLAIFSKSIETGRKNLTQIMKPVASYDFNSITTIG